MKKEIRFGIIGGGLMGREFASTVMRWCSLLDFPARPYVTAVCSRRDETLTWFSDNFEGIRLATTDYHELVESPRVDAVYCAVPHDLHKEIYIAAIEAGKHLLGEKPFGIDREANAAILACAEEHPDVVVRCSSEFPYYPGAQRIMRYIREERFGKILEVECGFMHCSDINPQKPVNWMRTVKQAGEYGCMAALGMHVLHMPLRAAWVPKNVRAILSRVHSERPDGAGRLIPCETWDNAVLLCEVKCGGSTFPMTVKMQRGAPGETNTWYLSVKGTRFCARFSTRYPRTLETLSYEGGAGGRRQLWREEALRYEPLYATITGGIFEFGFSDAMLQMVGAFCHQVSAGGGAQLPFGCATMEETRLQHEIFTAALESHRLGSVVAL